MKFRKVCYYIIMALLLINFLFSAFYVCTYILDSREQKAEYDDLAALVEQVRQEQSMAETEADPGETASAETGNPEDPDGPTEEPESDILPEYRQAYEMNTDLAGWLSIDGTDVNYPVMQTPEKPDYYLHRNFKKEDNIHGCLYAREQCDVNAPSDNVTIYGHHMRDGSMFGSLEKYLKKSYWEEHDTLRFDTLTERHTYQIFAVFRTSASVGEGLRYLQFVDAADEEEFNDFVATCKELGRDFYDTGITPEYGDKLICLSTCEYTRENGRLVVAAVRID